MNGRDLAASSNDSGDSRPSPLANPNVERAAVMLSTHEFQAGAAFGVPRGATERYVYALLAAADAVDPLRQPGIIHITRDEATVELIADRLRLVLPGDVKQHHDIIRAVLDALAGAQP